MRRKILRGFPRGMMTIGDRERFRGTRWWRLGQTQTPIGHSRNRKHL